MNRRTFLRSAGSVAAISPLVLMSKLADIGRQKREPMQPMKTGQVLTASYLNEITERINELEQRL
jgi:hypothetical protein